MFHSSFCCSTVSQVPFIVEMVENFHSDSNKKKKKTQEQEETCRNDCPQWLGTASDDRSAHSAARDTWEAGRWQAGQCNWYLNYMSFFYGAPPTSTHLALLLGVFFLYLCSLSLSLLPSIRCFVVFVRRPHNCAEWLLFDKSIKMSIASIRGDYFFTPQWQNPQRR